MQDKKFDVDAITQELDEEFSDGEVSADDNDDVIEEAEEFETQIQEDTVEEAEEGEEEAEPAETEEAPVIDEELHKRNEAFRKLRLERDQMAKSDKFLEDLSSQYGMTKEQLIEKYTDELNKKKAQEQGIDPAQFKKMQEMEQKIQKIEHEKSREVFNVRANQLAERYRLNDNQMMQLFQYARELNVDITSNPNLLEFVYRAVNYDQAIEQGRQAQLQTTKKRQSTSTGRTGTSGKQVNTSEDDMQAEIDAFLKDQKIIKS